MVGWIVYVYHFGVEPLYVISFSSFCFLYYYIIYLYIYNIYILSLSIYLSFSSLSRKYSHSSKPKSNGVGWMDCIRLPFTILGSNGVNEFSLSLSIFLVVLFPIYIIYIYIYILSLSISRFLPYPENIHTAQNQNRMVWVGWIVYVYHFGVVRSKWVNA
jgi:hypothetical protein